MYRIKNQASSLRVNCCYYVTYLFCIIGWKTILYIAKPAKILLTLRQFDVTWCLWHRPPRTVSRKGLKNHRYTFYSAFMILDIKPKRKFAHAIRSWYMQNLVAVQLLFSVWYSYIFTMFRIVMFKGFRNLFYWSPTFTKHTINNSFCCPVCGLCWWPDDVRSHCICNPCIGPFHLKKFRFKNVVKMHAIRIYFPWTPV